MSQKWFITVPPQGAARQSALGAIRAFGTLGISHHVFDYASAEQAFARLMPQAQPELILDIINQTLIVQVLDHQADYLLVNALTPVTRFSLNLLRRQRVTTVHWFYEDYRRAEYWKDVLGGYDLFCAMQRGPLPHACKDAGSQFAFLPPGIETVLRQPGPPLMSRDRDVGFIGIPSPYRIAALEKLAEHGFSLAIAGHGWDRYSGPLDTWIQGRTWTGGESATKLYNSSKIGLNLSVDQPAAQPDDTQVSPRVFELAAHGLPIVTESVALLAESIGDITVETFTTMESLVQVVQTVLATLGHREPIGSANRAAAAFGHTFECRVRELTRLAKKVAQSSRENSIG